MPQGDMRSGMGAIVGDYLLGQFDRHGLSAAANILGPTAGQVDDLMELMHPGSPQGEFSSQAMRERAAQRDGDLVGRQERERGFQPRGRVVHRDRQVAEEQQRVVGDVARECGGRARARSRRPATRP